MPMLRSAPVLRRQVPRAPGSGGRYLVLLDGATDPTRAGARVTRRFTLAPAMAVSAGPEALRALQRDPHVRAIEVDEGGSGLLLEAEPLIGLDAVKGDGYTGAGVTVAIVDSGVDTSHPDLAGRIVDEACFCASGCCPGGGTTQTGPGSADDDNGHGTHVAGAIASQGGNSPQGGAPGANIVAVKVLDLNLNFCCMSDVIDALDWIAENHPEVRLVNLSLGANSLWSGDCDGVYSVLTASISALRQNGTLVIAASGNDNVSTAMRSPACISNVLSVGAVWDADVGPQSEYCSDPITAADQIACYSDASTTTDLLAPGGVIVSTWPGGGTHALSGTSHAAPMVTACAATLLEANPNLTPAQLELLLESTGKPLLDARNGITYPRVDCAAALAALPSLTAQDAGSGDGGMQDAGAGTPDAGRGEAEDAGAEDAGARDASTPDAAAADGAVPPARPDAGTQNPGAAGAAGRDGTGGAGPDRDAGPIGVASGGDAATSGSGAHRVSARSIAPGHGAGCACRAVDDGGGVDPLPFLLAAWLASRRRRRRHAR